LRASFVFTLVLQTNHRCHVILLDNEYALREEWAKPGREL